MIKGDKRSVGLYLSGKPVSIKELNIAITPPTINDIEMFGEDDFLFATQLIAHTDSFVEEIKKGNSELEVFSDFQILMKMIREDFLVQKILSEYFNFIFPDYIIKFTSNEIDFLIEQDNKEMVISRINPFTFERLKNVIGDLFIAQPFEEEIEYNPANDLAQQIADKIKEGRKKNAQIKSEQNKDQSLFAQIASSLSIGLKMDIRIFYEYTPFQLYDAYKRFFLKQAYDLYQKISITPLMDNSKMDVPEDWTKYLY